MNQLHPIAQAVQSQGRGKDTQLVHMTPNEVAGLQALAMAHGGSLTINPTTGLPEAGFLEDMLPTIAGFALNAFVPGLGTAMSGFAIPALVGGATALMNDGDIGKGLMAGLGAWGGMGLSNSLLNAGAAGAAAPQIGNQAIQAAGAGAEAALNPAMTSTPYGYGPATATVTGVSPAQLELTNQYMASSGITPVSSSPVATATQMPQMSTAPVTTMDKLSTGFRSAMNAPGQFLSDNWKQTAAAAAPAAMGLLSSDDSDIPKDTEQYQYDYSPGRVSETDLAAQRAANPQGELTYFRPSFGPRRVVNVAQGGLLSLADGGPTGAVEPVGINNARPMDADYFKDMATNAVINAGVKKGLTALGAPKALAALGPVALGLYGMYKAANPDPSPAPVVSGSSFPSVPGQNPGGDSGGNGGYTVGDGTQGSASMSDYGGEADLAKGGIAGLAAGGMSKGGFVVPADVVSALGNGSTDAGLRTLQAKLGAVRPIKGKGDGLSDSIKTSIDGEQPARVADGEAYIPPSTVAKVGGGDASKGAKKLYAMMDRVRKQAHGKTTQQRKVNPRAVV